MDLNFNILLFLTIFSGNKYPRSWTSVGVKELFEAKSNEPSNTTNLTTSNPTVQSSHSSSPMSTSPSRLSHGAIAGIVVGCTAAIILGAVSAIFTKKYRLRSTKSTGFPPELASASSVEPPLGELPAERRVQEILSSYQDLTELTGTSRRYPIELSASRPTITELSTENY